MTWVCVCSCCFVSCGRTPVYSVLAQLPLFLSHAVVPGSRLLRMPFSCGPAPVSWVPAYSGVLCSCSRMSSVFLFASLRFCRLRLNSCVPGSSSGAFPLVYSWLSLARESQAQSELCPSRIHVRLAEPFRKVLTRIQVLHNGLPAASWIMVSFVSGAMAPQIENVPVLY